MTNKILTQQIEKDIEKLFSVINNNHEFIPGKSKIRLMSPTFNHEEILEALDSMISTNVSMGHKVSSFEKLFSKYCKSRFATMVNSGSSANLLACSILTNPQFSKKIKPGSEVITPAVTWATTIFPLVNVGLKPKLIDVDLETFCIDTDQIKDAINNKTGLILPVHLLGNVCEMDKIVEISTKNNILLMEDCCEAPGARFHNKSVGTFGDLGSFSFFMSHHITTIEGGMLISNDVYINELSKMLRAFGWIRDIKKKNKKNEYPHIDPRFLFVNLGFNMRPTEIQGSFGIKQISKLNKFIKIRKENNRFWNKSLKFYEEFFILPKEQKNAKQVYFSYPLTIKPGSPFTRKQLTDFLERKKIETRPIMAGNMDEQPVMKIINYSKKGSLPNSKLIMRNSFFIGNHQGIGKEERNYVADVISQFIERKLWKKYK